MRQNFQSCYYQKFVFSFFRPPPPPPPTLPPNDPRTEEYEPETDSQKQGYPQVAPVPTSCAPGYDANHCPSVHKNGVCDPECNTPACGLDGGDCRAPPPPPPPREEPSCARGYPASHCPSRASNGVCDPVSIIFKNFQYFTTFYNKF